MLKRLLLIAAVSLFPALASAQTPVVGNERLTWNQGAPTLATAQAYEYRAYIDGGAGVVVPTTCTGTASPFVCSTPFPASTPGVHNTPGIEVTATLVSGTVRAESLRSAPLPFILLVAPIAPANLRIAGLLPSPARTS